MHIAIIGGSIAGLISSIVLSDLGVRVSVFERSSKDKLSDRGAGIMLPEDLVKQLIALNIFPENFNSIHIRTRIQYVYDQLQDQSREIHSMQINSAATHWGALYQALINKVDSSTLHYGVSITNIEDTQVGVTLTLDHNKKEQFDYVIFADGVNSIGRAHYFPSLKPEFSHYIAWRGTKVARNEDDIVRRDGQALVYMYPFGHLLIYPIPDPQNKDQCILNWVLYENISSAHVLWNKVNHSKIVNIPQGGLNQSELAHLRSLATTYFSSYPRDLMLETKQPFVQSIADLLLPQLFQQHALFIGDSATLLRPHVGAGSTKALQNTLALQHCIKVHSNFSEALIAWSQQQTPQSANLFKLGRVLGNLLVTQMPDWNEMSDEQVDQAWRNAISGKGWYLTKKPDSNC